MIYAETSASERRFLPPAVAVSTVAFALRPPAEATIGDPGGGRAGAAIEAAGAGAGAGVGVGAATLWIPLVRRTREPFRGLWALPGGPTRWDETLADTALRSIRAAALRSPAYLEQLYSFGGVERSADAQRLVTIAYWSLYSEDVLAADPDPEALRRDPAPAASSQRRWDDPAPGQAPPEAAPDSPGVPLAERDPNVAWFSADQLPELAFDHAEIVATALSRLRTRTEYAAVAHRFLGHEFTLSRLRAVTEAVLGQAVDPANFRRQALARGELEETGEVESGTRHRPAKLYRFRDGSGAGPGLRGRGGLDRLDGINEASTRSMK
ncbi:NUDIX hydrolase [Leucobacter luti]|uniref:NUDIX hydrolase n=1 Tax=Leucobacter luti TaxID=340320 RepID=UPI003CFF2CB5